MAGTYFPEAEFEVFKRNNFFLARVSEYKYSSLGPGETFLNIWEEKLPLRTLKLLILWNIFLRTTRALSKYLGRKTSI